MSEQEKKSGSSGGSVVMVEKTASSRHKPYRPTELQDENPPDLHKRSRAPAVPSVAEELKDSTANQPPTTMDRVESEREHTSDKQKHVSKNISSSKRRGTSEEIAMVAIETKKDNIGSQPQPIPHQSVVADPSNLKESFKDVDKKADDDSITEDITELRTDAVKEHSEWPTHSGHLKKKEITWKDNDYLNKVRLQPLTIKSQATLLERKASVGPCFKPIMLYGGPSGISICVPKKSIRSMKEDSIPIQSVINFNVTKKISPHRMENRNEKRTKKDEKEDNLDQTIVKFFGICRGKIDSMTYRIRNLLNI